MSDGRNTVDAPDWDYGRRTAPEASWPHGSRCQCQHCRAVGNVTSDRPTGPATAAGREVYEKASNNSYGEGDQEIYLEDILAIEAETRARIFAALPAALYQVLAIGTFDGRGPSHDHWKKQTAALVAAIEKELGQ